MVKALLLAGGKGTRLQPLTYKLPKPIVPIMGRPLLERVIMNLKSNGIDEVIISTCYKSQHIKNYFKAYITDAEIRDIVETKEYPRFATNPKVTLKDFRDLNGWREVVPEYVKDYVSINTFM